MSKELSFLLAVVILIGLLAAPPVLALERAGAGAAYLDPLVEQRAPDDLDVVIYFFGTRLAINAEEQVVVVEGRGTLSGGGQKERFSFTATFRNNGDGTVFVAYAASRPDASFIIASVPGSSDISVK